MNKLVSRFVSERIKPVYVLFHSPYLLLAGMALAIFFVEFMVMIILSLLSDLPPYIVFALDSTLLVLFLIPSLYFFVLSPLKLHISQRYKAEGELSNSLEMLRKLSNRLLSLQEEERKHIAAEIHDELGQTMTALKAEIFTLGKSLPLHSQENCRDICSHVDGLIKSVQRISTELRPNVLDNLGLEAAIEWHVENFSRWAGIECGVVTAINENRISDTCAIALFRIVQESLTNVARHSGANYVRVKMKESNGQIVLKVVDNGRGIARHKIFAQESLGLMGMRERVNALNGRMRIRGIPGRGSAVLVTIPINSAGADA